MGGPAIEQRDLWMDAKLKQRCLQHVTPSAGDLQDVRALSARHPRECAPQQPGMQAQTAEASVGESDRIERCIDFRRGAAVLVEPLVLNNSFHNYLDDNKRVTIS
jgi:hypothetical protein